MIFSRTNTSRSPEPQSLPEVTEAFDARPKIEALLAQAIDRGASDLHLEPTGQGMDIRLRIDGLLSPLEQLSAPHGRNLVNRLMVMAQLLTYRLEIPQEGRIAWHYGQRQLDLRLAIVPTLHGIRATLRLPSHSQALASLEQLGLPGKVRQGLEDFLASQSGMLILCGPAGSGKTTTIYALMEELVTRSPGLSILSLEDPVERPIRGVTQIEVSAAGPMTYETALRSLLRQDPQVLVLGEIRDRPTAALAIQAALSGHRLITTLHAADALTALIRLQEMGLESYQLASVLHGVVAMRLVRKLDPQASGDQARYRGRLPVAEYLAVSQRLKGGLLARQDLSGLRQLLGPEHETLHQAADRLIREGQTDRAEVQRVVGQSPSEESR